MGRGTTVVADKKYDAGAQPLDPRAMVRAGVEPRKGGMGAEQRHWAERGRGRRVEMGRK
jgi:hypothetical protein